VRPALFAAGIFLGIMTAAAAAPPAGTPLSFLTCPLARDTGPDTDLCFFAEHDGVRYALANPPDWGVPQLKHQVLVEGRVKEGPQLCGAVPIEGRASVMTEIDESCNVVIPFDNIIKGTAGGVFNSGTPQQRAFAEDLAKRAALDPRLSVEPAIRDPAPTPAPTPPFQARTLVILFPFDSDRGSGPDMLKLKELAVFAQVANAKSVRIVGYGADSLLSDGSRLTERAQISQARATKIAQILGALGVNAKVTRVNWEAHAIQGSGDGDWRNRRVEISVDP